MKERVYLGDWAYNAGIIGFIDIMLDGKDITSQNIITIGPNYIEFDRNSLQGFSDKFFKKAYQRYPRTDELIDLGNKLLQRLENNDFDKNLKQEVSNFKKRVEGFSKLKQLVDSRKLTLPRNFNKTDAEQYVSQITDLLNANKQGLIEDNVKTYLKNASSICGDRSFLNRNFKGELKKKFFDDFEGPIVNQTNRQDKNHDCIFCGLRPAKKDALLDTGLVSFLGANKDNKNFFWNFKPQLPICEICELIYFCIFAGLTEFRIGQTKKFYFVDRNTSVLELYQTNKLFMEMMSREENILKEKGILNFINDYLLLKLKEESKFRLANIMFIEIDLTSSVTPKLYGFSITKQKAEFINSNFDIFKKITGSFIKFKDNNIYPFSEFMQKFMNNTLSFQFLSFLEGEYLSSQKPNSKINTNLSPYRLQMYNILTYKYLKSIKRGGELMDEKWLWKMYFFGQELKKKFLSSKAENKITSLAYRLISALRIGDVNTFMNLIIRTYMSYNMEVPALFVSCINDRDNFCALGYSFVNGLLGSEKDEKVENSEEVVGNE
ncbi:type I-B CRISPR-associated protein Cas8b1/Cst1 [Thermoanaerobacter sp. CM-CNRG TB177]|jgi:CRISPR-associated protein Cst1|uniref:type I-B CRISPR-associated protein Cas8b1/Cst1 n=1 Tax=Thermoanaerobacter sp. CM-CNRG TB177 TaxID=2800659 RepID=UPI000EC48601|nr:type I-B CRISPR-associated protein Cas8b1/Cst1 [Thermoanaerobacter sp. CM-CNRG TB177]MBT1279397.1 type I-B CRISPR-associated protein Cas8b1/Cst1 [Thermoanaerobacter sp. CM-CNRG TB177]HAA80153.1 type I-B CRISPR-associated protein Cas8b1/Cst1 [Thermoanaerobacter sp.]